MIIDKYINSVLNRWEESPLRSGLSAGLRFCSKRVRTSVALLRSRLGKVWTFLFLQLWVTWYHRCSSTGMTLTLNNTPKVDMSLNKETKPKTGEKIYTHEDAFRHFGTPGNQKWIFCKILNCYSQWLSGNEQVQTKLRMDLHLRKKLSIV